MRWNAMQGAVVGVLAAISGSLGSASAAPSAAWTVVLYFDGDAPTGYGDLEGAVVDRLNAVLTTAGPHPDVHVLALVDRRVDGDATAVRVRPFGATAEQALTWTGAKLLRLEQGHAEEIAPERELNLAAPATLADVLELARTTYPAERYALALKSHGLADDHVCLDADPTTGAADALTIEELRDTLRGFAAGRGRPLDLLAIDACSMATVDTLAALGPYVDAFAASDDLLFGRSLPYAALVGALQSGACSAGLGAAEAAVAAYPEDAVGAGNVPSACAPGGPFGSLAAVPTVAVAQLQASFDLLGRTAMDALAAGGPEVRERLAVARWRAFETFGVSGMHLDALSVAEAIEANVEDPVLRWVAAGAASAARNAATAVRQGADLAGTCGISVYWPCGGDTARYVSNPLWAARGWPQFVGRFLANQPDCFTAPAVGNDLSTQVTLASPAVVVTAHRAGLAGAAPYVGRRGFFAYTGSSISEADALFRVPFAAPMLVDGKLPQSPKFVNRWAYGRLVFVGEPTTAGGPAFAECPLESIRVLPGWSGVGPATCAALTTSVRITLPNGWVGDAQLRLVVRQTPPAPAPPTGFPTAPWWVPPPPWTARVVCAYTSSASVEAAVPVPSPLLNVVGGPGGGPPAGPVGPVPSGPTPPDWRRDIPRPVPLPVGTKLRTVRRVSVEGRTQEVLGPEIRLTASGNCIVWRRFPTSTRVTVGHAETVSTGAERSSSRDVRVP